MPLNMRSVVAEPIGAGMSVGACLFSRCVGVALGFGIGRYQFGHVVSEVEEKQEKSLKEKEEYFKKIEKRWSNLVPKPKLP